MFKQLANLLNAPGSGILVDVFIGVLSYVQERIRSRNRATIDDYLEWLRRRNHEELLEGERQILAVLEMGAVESQIAQDYLHRLILHVEEQADQLSEIMDRTSRLPSMDQKLDLLLEEFSSLESGRLLKGQVAVCAKVLDVLARGVRGAGARVLLERKPDLCKAGTLHYVWLLGEESPHMMLADYVGSIHDNRISLILNPDGSLAVQAYDGAGSETMIQSPSYPPKDLLTALVVWKDRELSLWVNGSNHGSAKLNSGFKYLGPVLLFGMDIEGKLSADAVRWAPPGQQAGLQFQKEGIWHGSRMDLVALWERVLTNEEIAVLAKDPYAMFRLAQVNTDGDRPNCGDPIRPNPSKVHDKNPD